MMGIAPGSGQSGNQDEQGQPMVVQELSWSPDTKLLGAALNDYVGIFDMSKVL